MEDENGAQGGRGGRRITSPAIMMTDGVGKYGTPLDDALEKIFHPERFNLEKLTPEIVGPRQSISAASGVAAAAAAAAGGGAEGGGAEREHRPSLTRSVSADLFSKVDQPSAEAHQRPDLPKLPPRPNSGQAGIMRPPRKSETNLAATGGGYSDSAAAAAAAAAGGRRSLRSSMAVMPTIRDEEASGRVAEEEEEEEEDGGTHIRIRIPTRGESDDEGGGGGGGGGSGGGAGKQFAFRKMYIGPDSSDPNLGNDKRSRRSSNSSNGGGYDNIGFGGPDEDNNTAHGEEAASSHRLHELKRHSRWRMGGHGSGRTSDTGSACHIRGLPKSNSEKAHMNKLIDHMYTKGPDRPHHDLFVEMDELEGEEWVEHARWIKYEEALEEGANRWGRPHVSTMTFHSLINLWLCLESGVMLLDLEARDFTVIADRIVEQMCLEGIVPDGLAPKLMRTLLLRHRHVQQEKSFAPLSGIRKNFSQRSLSMVAMSMHHHHEVASHDDESVLRCLTDDAEGSLTMAGTLEGLDHPACAFVRLAPHEEGGTLIMNAMEIKVPLRFVFVLLTPKPSPNIDYHEVGRAFSTVMSNPMFQGVCYRIEGRRELLSAINHILDDSVVLPPGDWDTRNLLSADEIEEMRLRRQKRQKENEHLEEKRRLEENGGAGAGDDKERLVDEYSKEVGSSKKADEEEDGDDFPDPLQRTSVPFGGIINDVKRRYPWYWSDIKDALSVQCFGAVIFIFFASLSPTIAFGGLYGDKTEGLIGIPVSLVITCLAGVIFALLSGMPLVIVGITGPVMIFDEALFKSAKSSGVEFLVWRVWTAIWLVIIALTVAAFQGSILVKYFTRFTKDIFASVIAVIYLFEAFKKLYLIFQHNPLVSLETYCNVSVETTLHNLNHTLYNDLAAKTFDESFTLVIEEAFSNTTGIAVPSAPPPKVKSNEPNVALLSFILMIGTYSIATYLKIFRNGKYLGRTARRSLGDFGIPIAIVVMVGVDLLLGDNFTQKLIVPSGLQLTSPEKRGWIINPMGIFEDVAAWAIFAAIIPAGLLYLILFFESNISELILLDKANTKGVGLHLDIVLICLLNVIAAFIGAPWVCGACVRSLTHLAALTVMSTTHAPGELPRVVNVYNQRLTGLFVAILVGLSVLLAPVLQLIPYPVLFGVFLYMGFSALFGGLLLFDRIFLLFMPVKHHPQVSYVRRVKTWKMHLFTAIQFSGLALLIAIMLIPSVSLFFPLFVVAMIPLRMSLKFIFTPRELDALDGPDAGQMVKDDDPDFYDQGYGH